MKRFLCALTATGLMAMTVAAQTAGEASGSANTSTSVQAGQANANVNSNTSANADAQTSRTHGQTNAGSNESGDSAASVNGNSVNAGTNGGATLAAGTTIPATLTKSVDARKAKAGDEISAKTTEEVRSASGVVIPRGSRLVGHVTDAKAKAKGDSESALGIAFDHAVVRDGQQVPFNASIRAIAAAANNTSASMGDDNFGAGSGSAAGGGVSAPAAGAGGPLGGAGRTLGGATSAVGNTAGGVANTAGNLGANAGGAVYGTARGAAGQLTSQSQGVIGFNGLQLSSAASNSTQGSVITSTGKDVKLDSGTQILLQVNQQ